MSKSIVVFGFGPGISKAVAEKFGGAGFSVALVGRSAERLAAGAEALKAKGISTLACQADAGDPVSIRSAIGRARAQFGTITVVHWNAYGGFEAGDLLTASPAEVGQAFDVAVVGLLTAVQETLPDMKGTKEGAILVTNGAFADINSQIDEYAVGTRSMGVALANAAKHKLVGLLSQRLKGDGVYVGEVMVAGMVKGTASATGGGGIEPSAIADKFWALYQERGESRTRIA